MTSSGSSSEILLWDFQMMRPLYKEKSSNADVVHSAELIEGTDLIISGQSNGQLKVYDILKFDLVAETEPLGMEAWATEFNWDSPHLQDNIYQGSIDGKIREWKFDSELNKFLIGYHKWSHLDAVRHITTYPKYDLILSGSRVSPATHTMTSPYL